MSYFLAPALEQLRDEVNTKFPRRDKSSDGWIGDTSHSARPSDHNPDWNDNGIVRALDLDIDDGDPGRDLRRMILNATIGDHRVWYVISNGIIYSATYGFRARRYTGSNGHYAHVHVSLRHNAAEFDKSRWFAPDKPKIKLKPVDLSNVREQFLNAANNRDVDFSNGVGRIQQVLNRQYGANLMADGFVGPATLKAWREYEMKVGGNGRVSVPDSRSIVAMSKGHFRVVE